MKKILIADDSKTVFKLLSTLLLEYKNEDFEIGYAKDGADTLFALRDDNIDILFLDINMPLVDGFGIATFIKDRKIDVEIVMISANIDIVAMKRLGKLNIRNFLPKPLNTKRLATILHKVLRPVEKSIDEEDEEITTLD